MRLSASAAPPPPHLYERVELQRRGKLPNMGDTMELMTWPWGHAARATVPPYTATRMSPAAAAPAAALPASSAQARRNGRRRQQICECGSERGGQQRGGSACMPGSKARTEMVRGVCCWLRLDGWLRLGGLLRLRP